MIPKRVAVGTWLIFAVIGLAGTAQAVTFVPGDPADTDTAVLVDNFQVVVDGVETNPNAGFESGDLSGFADFGFGPVTVIDQLGSITPPAGDFFAFLHTGPGTTIPAPFCPGAVRQDRMSLGQELDVRGWTGDETITVSMDLNVLTNEPKAGDLSDDFVQISVPPPRGRFLDVFGVERPQPRGTILGGVLTFGPAPEDTGFAFQTGSQRLSWEVPQDWVRANVAADLDLIILISVNECWPPLPQPISKQLVGIVDASGDGIVEVNEPATFVVLIVVLNTFDTTWEDVIVKDRFGGEFGVFRPPEIEPGGSLTPPPPGIPFPVPIGSPSFVNPTQGDAELFTRGKTEKAFLTWEIGDLEPGQSALLVLLVYTDENPGGNQEFTESGSYTLNSGATVKGLVEGEQVSFETGALDVKVVE